MSRRSSSTSCSGYGATPTRPACWRPACEAVMAGGGPQVVAYVLGHRAGSAGLHRPAGPAGGGRLHRHRDGRAGVVGGRGDRHWAILPGRRAAVSSADVGTLRRGSRSSATRPSRAAASCTRCRLAEAMLDGRDAGARRLARRPGAGLLPAGRSAVHAVPGAAAGGHPRGEGVRTRSTPGDGLDRDRRPRWTCCTPRTASRPAPRPACATPARRSGWCAPSTTSTTSPRQALMDCQRTRDRGAGPSWSWSARTGGGGSRDDYGVDAVVIPTASTPNRFPPIDAARRAAVRAPRSACAIVRLPGRRRHRTPQGQRLPVPGHWRPWRATAIPRPAWWSSAATRSRTTRPTARTRSPRCPGSASSSATTSCLPARSATPRCRLVPQRRRAGVPVGQGGLGAGGAGGDDRRPAGRCQRHRGAAGVPDARRDRGADPGRRPGLAGGRDAPADHRSQRCGGR